MVQTYATLERVGSKGLSSVKPSSDTIKGIKMEEMLPSENDEKVLQQELSIMVSSILTTHVPTFAGLDTQWSIPHQYSAQSALKSDIVSDLKIISSSAAIMLFVHNIMLIQTHNFQFRKTEKKLLENINLIIVSVFMLKISISFITQIPLGVLNKDESTPAGMIEILEDYTRYVPRTRDEVPFP